jgi:hypothetical protein
VNFLAVLSSPGIGFERGAEPIPNELSTIPDCSDFVGRGSYRTASFETTRSLGLVRLSSVKGGKPIIDQAAGMT